MAVALTSIFAFLVKPQKAEGKNSPLKCQSIPLNGELFEKLEAIFEDPDDECNVPTVFKIPQSGVQANSKRDLFTNHISTPSQSTARQIASALELCTTKRSGLGLVFIMNGNVSGTSRFAIARFPADEGIMAEEKAGQLSVQFVQQVFLKNSNSFKAVIYEGLNATNKVWKGRAVDKQLSHSDFDVSQYWMRDFLESDLLTNSAVGSKRFANAIKDAANSANMPSIQAQLISASALLGQFENKVMSPREILTAMNLSQPAIDSVLDKMANQFVMNEKFRFSSTAFQSVVKYKVLQLDNGGVLVAPFQEFDSIFKEISSDGGGQTYQTKGRKVVQRLRVAKP